MKTYQQGLDCFVSFRSLYGLEQIRPPSLYDIVQFVAFLYKSDLAHSMVSCYISSLSSSSKINCFEDHAQKFVARKMLAGFKRSQLSSKDMRLRITREMLSIIVNILPLICKSQYEVRLFTATYSLTFHGFMRVGKLTVSNGTV